MKRYAVKGIKYGVSTIILYPDEKKVERTKQMLIDEGYSVEIR